MSEKQSISKRTFARRKIKEIEFETAWSSARSPSQDIAADTHEPISHLVPERTATRWKKRKIDADCTQAKDLEEVAEIVAEATTSFDEAGDASERLGSCSHTVTGAKELPPSVESEDEDDQCVSECPIEYSTDNDISDTEGCVGDCSTFFTANANIEKQSIFQNIDNQNNLLVLALKLKHKLSREACSDVLALINHLNVDNCVANSVYFLDKEFLDITSGFQFHFLCKKCCAYIGICDSSVLKCVNPSCCYEEPRSFEKNMFFAYLPLKEQLQDLLENHHIQDKIFVFNKSDSSSENFADVFDGNLYTSCGNATDISLSFNCDGVPIFKSSSCSIWPILVTVNELLPELRKDHVLLAALWFGSQKPNMNVFFEPFVAEIRQLKDNGFTWKRESDGSNICSKVRVLLGICDSVARPLLQGMTQFNGKHGCGYCLDAGVSVEKGRGKTRVYPYNENSKLRLHEDTVNTSILASTSESILGVKRVSILSLIPDFNMIEGLVPDYMHCILLGVVRQMLTLWCDSSNHKEPFYLDASKQQGIDKGLKCIRPPCNISRIPRSLSERSYWKAHEFYMWLLYYSAPILKSFLPSKYFRHWCLLVEGVSVLLGDCITEEQLNHCELIFVQFVVEFQHLYGLHNVSFNVHLCLHISKSARNWGPLWTHSAFVFEAYNKKLFEMIRSTQAVPVQICKTFLLHRALPSLINSAVNSTNCSVEYKQMLEQLASAKSTVQNSANIMGVTVLGRPTVCKLRDEHSAAFYTVSSVVPRDTVVSYYSRIIVNREIFHSSFYCASLKRNSYTVELVDGSLFSVDQYVAGDFGSGIQCYALGKYFSTISIKLTNNPEIPLKLKHIVCVDKQFSGQTTVVEAIKIKRKCLYFQLSNAKYSIVCRQVNRLEYCS